MKTQAGLFERWRRNGQPDSCPDKFNCSNMTTTPSLLNKLEELIDLALKAGTQFEQAAVYAAADVLRAKLEVVIAAKPGGAYLGEKVEAVLTGIARLTGFDAPGSTRAADATMAMGALSTLKLNLRD